MSETVIVVPCYNEALRLPADRFVEWVGRDRETAFLFVDDGSRDRTPEVLRELCGRAPGRLRLLSLDRNLGKGEAVRRGMLEAFARKPRYAGWLDADLAAPLETVPRLRGVLEEHPDVALVLGSRARLLGRTIDRSAARHYLGRVFATLASVVLGLPVYDTQCGAKLLKVEPATEALFGEPFGTRWLFDIEVLLRWTRTEQRALRPERALRIREEPLPEWRAVAGSKVGPGSFPRALWDLARLWRRYR